MAFDLTCFATVKAKIMSASSSSLGLRLVTVFNSRVETTPLSRDCTKEAARERAEREPVGLRIGKPAGEKEPQILLLGDDRLGLVARVGRDDDLGEDLDDLARRVGIERSG